MATEDPTATPTTQPEEGTPPTSSGDPPKDPPKDESPAPKSKSKDESSDTPKEGEKKPEEGEDSKEGEKEGDGPPEKYEAFELPEGFEVDEERLNAFHEYAKSYGLSQEAAQEAVNMHISAIETLTEQQQKVWSETKKGWEDEVRASKDLQGEDGKTDAALATALKAVEALGGDKLKEALELTGAGSHPAVVRAFYQIGKAIASDKIVFGGGATDSRSAAERMYPSMAKK